MTIALGLWFAFGVGVADYHGGFITKRATALATVATALVAGSAVMAALLVFVVDSTVSGGDLLLGACSGSFIGFALASLYHGMAASSAAVVAPIAATLASLVPFVWGLATGGSLPALGVVGAVIAFAGLALSTVSPELGDRVRIGVVWGLISGLCFGASLTFLGETGESSGLWPALVQRCTASLRLPPQQPSSVSRSSFPHSCAPAPPFRGHSGPRPLRPSRSVRSAVRSPRSPPLPPLPRRSRQ